MITRIATFFLFLVLATSASGQIVKPRQFSNSEDIDLAAVPTTPTAVASRSVFATSWFFSNTTAAPIVCTITNNKTPTPVTLWTGSVPANSIGGDERPRGVRMTGGVTWSCASTGVNGYVDYSY